MILFFTGLEDAGNAGCVSFFDMVNLKTSSGLSKRHWAIATSFIADVEWLKGFFQDCPLTIVKFCNITKFICYILNRHFDPPQIQGEYNVSNELKIIHPPMRDGERRGLFHAKSLLIRFPLFLRVIVTSGNLYRLAFLNNIVLKPITQQWNGRK